VFDEHSGMSVRVEAGVKLPDWITPRGVDPGKLPIEPLLGQALSGEDAAFRTACCLLASMVSHGRQEAAVVLLGLLSYHRHDLERLTEVVGALGASHTPEAADALVGELRRVPSSARTRRYLNAVLSALSRFPREIAYPKLLELSDDPAFSVRWRGKFADSAWRLGRP
jgi:hypothetical protein